jgi:hypothetical protein
MDSTAPVTPRFLLVCLGLGALPALAALLLAPELLQFWDVPVTAGVLIGGVLLVRRAQAAQVGELPLALPLALLIAVALPASLHLRNAVPASNDERAYLYQAELFAEGRIAEPLQTNELVDFSLRRRQVHEDRGRDRDGDGQPDRGTRYSKYPPGTSAFLTPGVWLGWPPLMVVLASLANILLTTALARQYGLARPAMAGLLLAVSPFFLLVQSSFQSEVATLPFALAAWWALLQVRAGGKAAAILVGLCCGAIFLSRPLTGVVAALACAIGLATLAGGIPARGRALLFATLGGLPLLGLALLYNQAQTGQLWLTPYHAYAQAFGPWQDATLPAAERVTIDVYGQGELLAGLGRQAARWSVGMGMLGAALIGFAGLWRLRGKDGGAALAFAVLLPLAYSFHWYPGHWAYLGPLYGYESLGLLLIGWLSLLNHAPPPWGRNLTLALASWGAIVMLPRVVAIDEQVQMRSAPERVAAEMQAPAVLLLPYVAVPSMHEYGMKHWTPSRIPSHEPVAIVRELARPDHTRRSLEALGLRGRPIFRLSPRTTARAGEADYEALPAPDLEADG